jgi:hypothetical protein
MKINFPSSFQQENERTFILVCALIWQQSNIFPYTVYTIHNFKVMLYMNYKGRLSFTRFREIEFQMKYTPD